MGADVAGCPSNDGAEDLCVTGARFALVAAPEVAPPGNNNHGQEDCKYGREASGERCPVYVDKRETMVALVKGNVVQLVGNVVCDTELLPLDVVNDLLAVSKHGGRVF